MKKELTWKICIYVITFLATLLYIFYRVFFTLPTSNSIDLFFAILVLVVEIIDAIFYSFFVFNILIYRKESPKIPKIAKKDYPDVDIFIATINEKKELLEKTIKSCLNMRYPNKKKVHIYICDDGNRKEIKELCKLLRVNYICRKDNENAKAGNYNNALKQTKSPYVAMFDADMCPNEKFLLKTIPFFIKEYRVGFVQLPQSFSELDFFQAKFKFLNKIPFEQDYFYHQIQMAKNNTNSVVCCGTNMVMSRKALEDIGGFATKTITEDIATGMLLEASGYKAIAIADDEVYGLNVNSTESLLKQRLRWCRGCIQILKNYSIIRNNNLNNRQKLDYLSAIYYWFFGLRNIFYLLVPLLFSIFNVKVIQCNTLTFLTIFAFQYILKRFVIDRVEGGKVSSTWNRIYEIILSPIIAYGTIKELLGFSTTKFEVTSKDKNNNDKYKYKYSIGLYIVHLVLLLLTITGIVLSAYKGYNLGIEIYYIPLFWLITNFIYLCIALIFDCSKLLFEGKNIADKYKMYSVLLIPINYIKHEFKFKEWVTTILLAIFLVAFVNTNFTKMELYDSVENKSAVSYNGYLKTKDGKLVNEKQEVVHLRGVSTHNLYYYGDLYNYDNIKELVDTWKINVFRVALYTDPSAEGYIKNNDVKYKLEEIIDECIDLDIYVIIDWHILNDNNPNIYKTEALDFFNEMSTKYQDVPNVIYEICNEPNGDVTWDNDIKPYAEQVIKTIRNNSEDSLILVGTADWSKDIESVVNNPLKGTNIMYVLHFYSEGNMPLVQSKIEKAINAKIPVFITECSVTDATGDGTLYKEFFDDLIDYLENKNISWIVWQFSDKFESSSLLLPKENVWKERKEKEQITDEELSKEIYNINDYLSETGQYVKELLKKYNNER